MWTLRFHEKNFPKKVCIPKICIQKQLNATYGAKMRGCVFKIDFRWLAGEFEPIETCSGFAQLLEKDWN